MLALLLINILVLGVKSQSRSECKPVRYCETDCPNTTGLVQPAECWNLTMHCTDLSPQSVILAIKKPTNGIKSKGTIVLSAGGSGQSGFGSNYIPYLNGDGFTTVQDVYVENWNECNSGQQNIQRAAARPAFTHRFIFDYIHEGDRKKGFSSIGSSGGAYLQMASLAAYGADDYLDYSAQQSGPNFSNVTAECIWPPPPNITVCPECQVYQYCNQTNQGFPFSPSFYYTFGDCSAAGVQLFGLPCACSNHTYTQSDLDWFLSQSIVQPDNQLRYRYTKMSSWLCDIAGETEPNVSVSQGQYSYQSIYADNGWHQYLITNCTGAEGITGSGSYYITPSHSAFNVTLQDLISNTVPRHQNLKSTRPKFDLSKVMCDL